MDRPCAARRSGTARAPPRRASGSGAAASSRGCRRRRRCRACRRSPGPRRGAACPGSARRSTRRGRTPRSPRGRPTRTARGSPRWSRATFMPRPPPPNAALIAIGSAVLLGERDDLVGVLDTGSRVPGTSGAPARMAMWRAVTLSPRSRIDCGLGPIQISPASMTACAKSAFSREESVAGVDRRRRRLGARRRAACRCRGRTRPRSGRRARTPRRRAGRAARRGRARRRRRRWRARRPAGADHPDGDLTAVGDEHLAQARHGSASSWARPVPAPARGLPGVVGVHTDDVGACGNVAWATSTDAGHADAERGSPPPASCTTTRRPHTGGGGAAAGAGARRSGAGRPRARRARRRGGVAQLARVGGAARAGEIPAVAQRAAGRAARVVRGERRRPARARATRPAPASASPPRPPACAAGRAGRRRAGRGRSPAGPGAPATRAATSAACRSASVAARRAPIAAVSNSDSRAHRRLAVESGDSPCRDALGGHGRDACGDRVELGGEHGGGRVAAVAFQHHRHARRAARRSCASRASTAAGTGSVCVSW